MLLQLTDSLPGQAAVDLRTAAYLYWTWRKAFQCSATFHNLRRDISLSDDAVFPHAGSPKTRNVCLRVYSSGSLFFSEAKHARVDRVLWYVKLAWVHLSSMLRNASCDERVRTRRGVQELGLGR